MLIEPRPNVMFGDLFEAEYLFDIHLRKDAVQLGGAEFPPKAKISGTLYSAADGVPQNADFVLGHGLSGWEAQGRVRANPVRSGRAVVLSDDCVIETVYGNRPNRESARGRLLFALVRNPLNQAELEGVQESNNWGRLALEPTEQLANGGIIELRRTFNLEARDADPDDRLASMDDKSRAELEQHWNAFACRRGPLAATNVANNVAVLLAGAAEPGESAVNAGIALGRLLEASWQLEGRQAERIAERVEIRRGNAAETADDTGGKGEPGTIETDLESDVAADLAVLEETMRHVQAIAAMAEAAADQLQEQTGRLAAMRPRADGPSE